MMKVQTLIFSLCLAGSAWAAPEKKAAFTEISITELEKMLAEKQAQVFDANDDETRQKYGVIPGAKLLTHWENFDVNKELPKSKSECVVFYCGSEACSAAPDAAQKANKAGYTNVRVLSAGIKGWVKAGRKIEKPATTAKS